VLFVSHNMGSIQQLCSNAILLENGKLSLNGSAAHVVESYISNKLNTQAVYNLETSLKSVYFNQISSSNGKGETCSDFLFNEQIELHFSFTANELHPSLQVGIGLQNRFNNRVFTVLREVRFFKKRDDRYYGSLKLPSHLIAPNKYSFVFALWLKNGTVYDLVENVCNINVHDSGTELAIYEGDDYGDVIVDAVWE